ncbi:hypothetical protein, partial [Fusobacterium nucleatum]
EEQEPQKRDDKKENNETKKSNEKNKNPKNNNKPTESDFPHNENQEDEISTSESDTSIGSNIDLIYENGKKFSIISMLRKHM